MENLIPFCIYPFAVLMVAITGPHHPVERQELRKLKADRALAKARGEA